MLSGRSKRIKKKRPETGRFFFALFQLIVGFAGGDDGIHYRAAETALFQSPHTLNGGAAGRTDSVLHGAGVLTAGERQLCGAQHHRHAGRIAV